MHNNHARALYDLFANELSLIFFLFRRKLSKCFEDGSPRTLVKVIVSDCFEFSSNGLLSPKCAIFSLLSQGVCSAV